LGLSTLITRIVHEAAVQVNDEQNRCFIDDSKIAHNFVRYTKALQTHGREVPRNLAWDTNANCPRDFVIFNIFKHQTHTISSEQFIFQEGRSSFLRFFPGEGYPAHLTPFPHTSPGSAPASLRIPARLTPMCKLH